jgi:hypothetical protein
MKKLILILCIITSVASGQVLIDPQYTAQTSRVNDALVSFVNASGTDTYTGSLGLTGKTGYFNPLKIDVFFTNTNTTTSTFNLNGWGAKTIKKYVSNSLADLDGGDLQGWVTLRYNGTYWVAFLGGSGSSSLPPLSPGYIYVGNGSSIATAVPLSGDGTLSSAGALAVTKINGTSLAGLATGILKNTTSTGVPSIAVAGTDYQAPITFGTGVPTALGVNIGSSGAPVLFNGDGGSPSSITLPSSATGTTQSPGDNSTKIATTAYANAAVTAAALPAADATHDGYLTQTDWSTFNTSATGVRSAALGGTGLSTYAVGDLIYASATTPTLSKLAGVATGNSLISGGVNTAPSWGKITSSHIDATVQTAGLSWLLASGGTLSGANTITGSTTNTLKGVFNSLGGTGTTITNGAGLWLANNTAASSGNQQVSPTLVLEGQGWGTTAGTSQSIKIALVTLPIQGTTATGNLQFNISTNGGAYSNMLTLTGSGVSASTYAFPSGAGIQSPSNVITYVAANSSTIGHQFNHSYSSAASNGVGIDFNMGFAPTSASTTYKGIRFDGTINQTGGANGATTMIDAIHTLTAAVGTHTFLHYKPTETSVGTHYFIVNESTTALSGFATATPNSTLHTAGSFAAGYVAKTGTYTATSLDYTIDCTSGTFTVTLPTAVGITGRMYVISNSGAGTITIGTTSSQTFANVIATPTTLTMSTVGARTVQSNGANWILISSL